MHHFSFETFIIEKVRPNDMDFTIPYGATLVNGFTREMFLDENQPDQKPLPTFKATWLRFLDWTMRWSNPKEPIYLVAYNGFKFDFAYISRSLENQTLTDKPIFLVDPWYSLT
jgi:hypothetical protein